MIGTVEFYRIPGALSTQEYPIFSSGQDISSYLVHSIDDCKFTRDVAQGFGPVEAFEGYENVNIAKFNGEYYWIVNRRTRTLKNKETVYYGLVYNAPTSILHLGDRIRGAFVKTPTQIRAYMGNSISNDTYAFSRAVVLPHLPDIHGWAGAALIEYSRKPYWVEVANIDGNRRGFFIWNPKFGGRADWRHTLLPGGTDSSDSSRPRCYPPANFFSDIKNTIGWTQEQVSSIHISERCPFAYTIGSIAYSGKTFDTIFLDNFSLKRFVEGTSTTYPTNGWGYEITQPTDSPEVEYTASLNLSEMERAVGSVRIINESGGAIATVPTQYAQDMEFKIRPISDSSGLFTEVSFAGRVVTVLTEGFVPYTGSAWESYMAYSMSYDREQVAINKQINNAELNLSIEQARGNAMLGIGMSLGAMDITNPVGIVGGAINIAGQIANEYMQEQALAEKNRIENRALSMNQALQESRMRAAPDTAYNTGYGFIYIYNTEKHPAEIRLEMPKNVTADYYAAHVAEWGYPCEGVVEFDLSPGYLQGQIFNDGMVVGERFDMLSDNLSKGIKIRVIN